ncbi:response regulator transcription factor [Periweissella fabalis]|uniref:Response regulator transcription factor n=1 Tax=Periweissella fabalis TaxID=1070421 RepID=A0A7X6S3K9_9LACO|nr:response regulator transcription factor [Periweissella fabalis]MCM0598153.1 response regulator transcription factor [Periweissella fabalis]NKZ24723.1 response regulator transcription factor [Periweissella fabalis]
MLRKTIAVIEDDQSIQDILRITLKAANFEVIQALSGKQAQELLLTNKVDLIILDLGLPDIDGGDLLLQLRKVTTIPVLVLTARTEINDKLALFNKGVDDYITKPFEEAELLARVMAVMKRTYNITGYGRGTYQSGALVINLEQQIVFKDGNQLHLTKNEYGLLSSLFQNPQVVMDYSTLIRNVWGVQILATQNETLRVTTANLRRKLGTFNGEQYIGTDIGVGYRWKFETKIIE